MSARLEREGQHENSLALLHSEIPVISEFLTFTHIKNSTFKEITMKRITYLVYDVNANVGGELHAASNEEWKQIMAENRRLPREQRRFFTEDRIVDTEVEGDR